MNNFAYVTIVTKTKYEAGAGRLYQGLKYFKSKYPLEILVSDNLTVDDLPFLTKNNIPYKKIKSLTFDYQLYNRYAETLSKCLVWLLINYDYVCFIDADIILNNNIDWGFDIIDLSKTANFYSAPKWQNSKVCAELFYCKPSLQIYNILIQFANKYKNYIATDEDLFYKVFNLLNTYNIIKVAAPVSEFHYTHSVGLFKFWEFFVHFKDLSYWFYDSPIEIFYDIWFNELYDNVTQWINDYSTLMAKIRTFEENFNLDNYGKN